MASEELFSQLRLCLVNLCSKSYTFFLYFILSYIYTCGSGSVLGIRIRIHNSVTNKNLFK